MAGGMGVLGLDVGTSACKAVVFSPGGIPQAAASRSYALHMPRPGWAELDAEEVWRHAADCIREACASARMPVRALAVCCQGEAFTAVDAEGKALCPAMVSSDARAAAETEAAVRERGVDDFYRRTGHTPHPLFTLFKLLWLKRHEPGIWSRARRFLCFEDFVHSKLGLDPAISWPLAGRTMLFDPARQAWDDGLLEWAGLEPERLARPMPSGSVAGEVAPSMARSLGLAPGCRVIAGGHDQVAAALGAGVAAPGQALYAMGTVECVVAVSREYRLAGGLRDANLCTYPHTVPGCHAHLAYNLTGANLAAWFREQFLPTGGAGETPGFGGLFARMPRTPTDLLVLPYFTSSGTPHFDVRARGAVVGLNFRHTRDDILRAMVEGLAFEMRLNLERMGQCGIPVHSFHATGGGTRSLEVVQIKADVLQAPITPTLDSEGGCMAAALLAWAALEGRPVQECLGSWVRLGPVVDPNPAHKGHYDEAFARYRGLYHALRPLSAPGPGKEGE